jgi:polar amino acid transport system substrate-binding protein
MSAMLAAVALAVGACGRDDTSAGAGARSGVELVKDGTITTCTHLSYRPFEFEQDGKIVGFDVDMIDLVAKKLGVRRSIVDTPFEGIQSGEQLNARKCDIAAAAMTITPERRRKIAFSSPYFDANQALLVRKDGAVGSLRDLAGRTLGVLAGTTGQLYAEKHAPPGAHLKDYKDLALLLGSVKSGRIHAAVNDLPVLLDYVKHHAGL